MKFSISARLMLHLGEALISDELVALMELIKNSYDADSNYSLIKISTTTTTNYGSGFIEIVDNGCGMNMDIIENSFLRLATDYKIKSSKFSKKFKRLSLGNKGIGRLALQRLGSFTQIITKDINNKSIEFSIDWSEFKNFEKEISDITINVVENENLDSLFSSNQGTIIRIYGLNNISFWDEKQTVTKFEKEMFSIINPYSDDDSKFNIILNLNGESFSSDKYDVKYLENLADTIVDFNFSENDNKLLIKIQRNRKYIDLRFDIFRKNYEEQLDIEKNSNLNFYFDIKEEVIIDFNSKINNQFSFLRSINLLSDNSGYFLPGDFSGRMFAFDKSGGRFDTEAKKKMDLMNGVKLFRNNFRIVPYGDEKNDWLAFTKYSQQFKANLFRQHTVAGYVYIDGESNLNKLVEMTNRQGFIDENYSRNFFKIMSEIVTKFSVQSDVELREKFNLTISDIEKITTSKWESIRDNTIFIRRKPQYLEEVIIASENLSSEIEPNILDNSEVSQFKNSFAIKVLQLNLKANQVVKQINQYKELYETEKEGLDYYKSIVGASIITESLAHEILGISKKIRNYISSIKNEINKGIISEKKLEIYYDLIISSVGYLERYASVLDVNSYTKRKKYEYINLFDFTNQILKAFPLFDVNLNNALKYKISGSSFSYNIIKSNYKIAIENLIVNSQYWTKDFTNNPIIYFEFNSEKREIIIWDNGPGIEPKIEKRIFEQYVSAKPDTNSRGMGLYIAQSLLGEVSSSISLLDERNSGNRLFKICIRFD